MVNNDIRSALSKKAFFQIQVKPGYVPKCDFNGNLHVNPEQIERVSCSSKVLVDRSWYTEDGKALILKPVGISYSPEVKEMNSHYKWGVSEEAKVYLYFVTRDNQKEYCFTTIDGRPLEVFIRHRIFNGGRLTKKRMDTVFKVIQETPEYLLISNDGKFANFDFDQIRSKVQKLLKIKGELQ